MKKTRLGRGFIWPFLVLLRLSLSCFGQDDSIASKPDGNMFYRTNVTSNVHFVLQSDATNGLAVSRSLTGNLSPERLAAESNGLGYNVYSNGVLKFIGRIGSGIPVPHDLRNSRVHFIQAVLFTLLFLPVAVILFEVVKSKRGEK